MSYDNIPEELRPLDLSEGSVNSLGQPVVGGPAASSQAALQEQSIEQAQTWYNSIGIGGDENTETIFGGVYDSFTSGGNWAYDLFQQQERDFEYPVDPAFDGTKWTMENKQKLGIPDNYTSAFGRTGSEREAIALLDEVKDRQQKQQQLQRLGGVGQFTAGMMAGMVDLDTLMTGGAAIAAKAGLKATRIGQAITGGAVAGSAGLLGTTASPEDDYADAALAALIGAGVASVIGPSKVDKAADQFNARVAAGIDELDAAVKARPTESPRPEAESHAAPFDIAPEVVPESAARKPEAFDPDEVEIVSETAPEPSGPSTVGAAQVQSPTLNIERPARNVENQTIQSKQYVRDNDLEDLYDYDRGPAQYGNAAQRAASKGVGRVADTLAAFGLQSDFDKMFRSASPTAKMVAHTLMADPSGRLANRNSAILKRDQLKNRYDVLWYQPYTEAATSFTRRKNVQALNLAEKNRQIENFNKQVMFELENLRLDGQMSRNGDPDVLRAAMAINDTMKYDLATGKKYDIPGYRDIPDSEGYFPRRVTTSAIDSQMRKAKALGKPISEKQVRQMWTEYYAHMSGLSMKDAGKVADMVLHRARTNAEGSHSNVYELLSQNGDQFLRGALKTQGLDEAGIDRIMGVLIGKSEERGKQGFMKGRVDGDIRFTASNGLRVIDFVDTDVEGILTSRSRSTTGRAALAEKGIRTSHDIQTIKDAIQYEQRQSAPDRANFADDPVGATQDFIDRDRVLDSDYLDAIFDHFTGGGKITDKSASIATRMKRVAILSTMNGLGLTQFAESGALAGAMGWRRFIQDLPASFRSDLSNPRSDLIQELQALGTLIPEERLWNAKLAADMDESLHAKNEWVQYFDQLTGMGLKAQGIISGMNKVRYAQQKMAMMHTIDKTMRVVAGKVDGMSPERLRTIGMDDDLIQRLQNVTQHITWDGDRVRQLNLDQWGDEQLVDEFARVMQISTDQLVQKARLGESNMIFSSNGLASLMTQFLSYPLTAIQKQAARNAYVGDTEALLQLTYGFLFAGTVGMAKEVIKGRYENLDAAEFARQGFTMANITGWVPLVSDPLMRMIGADNLTFNPYGDILRQPPAHEIVSRTLGSPAGLLGILDGDISGSDKADLRFLPLIGNWYGTTALLNRI